MNTRFIFNRFASRKRSVIFAFMLLWCAGLLAGIFLSVHFQNTYTETFLFVLQKRPSVLYFVLGVAIPVFFFSANYNRRFSFICYICILLEGINRGFAGIAVFYCFGSGSWLLRFLLLFSAIFRSIILWLLIVFNSRSRKAILYAVIAVVCVFLIDLLIISPQLIRLSTYF